MKKALFTPAEYRQLGHQFTGFMHYCSQVRSLVSLAYPFKSPLFAAIATAQEEGVFAFKCGLETLACTEHRTENFADAFWLAPIEHNQHLAALPGCSAEGLAFLTAAKERRRFEKKREPLTIDELKAVAVFLSFVSKACLEIIEKTGCLWESCPPAAEKLLDPFEIISAASLTFSQKWVRDEQA